MWQAEHGNHVAWKYNRTLQLALPIPSCTALAGHCSILN